MDLKKNFLKTFYVMVLTVFFSLSLSVAVFAQDNEGPYVVPGGPWLIPGQSETDFLQAFSTYDELVKELKQIERTSKGLLQLEVYGKTRDGRDLYLAVAGKGPDSVVIATQQHGNEPHGTEAAVNLLKFFSTGSAAAKKITDALTVYIFVRVNPDGCELWQRTNNDPSAPRAADFATSIGFHTTAISNETYGFYSTAGRGWDLNRFNFIDWTTSPMYQWFGYYYPENPGIESGQMAGRIAQISPTPLWFMDVHNQGSNINPEGEMVQFSLDTAHMSADIYGEDITYTETQQSARLLVSIWDYFQTYYPQIGITRYASPSAYPGRSRNQYMQVLGIPGMLLEMRGRIGQKNYGFLVKTCERVIMALINDTVDGSVWENDYTRGAMDGEIPVGTSLRNPHLDE